MAGQGDRSPDVLFQAWDSPLALQNNCRSVTMAMLVIATSIHDIKKKTGFGEGWQEDRRD